MISFIIIYVNLKILPGIAEYFFLLLPAFFLFLFLILLFFSTINTYLLPFRKIYRKNLYFYGFLIVLYLEFCFVFCFIIIFICVLFLTILLKLYANIYIFNDVSYENALLTLKLLFFFLIKYASFVCYKFIFFDFLFYFILFFSILRNFIFFFFVNIPFFLKCLFYLPIIFFKTLQYLFIYDTIFIYLFLSIFFFFLEIFFLISVIYTTYFIIIPLLIPIVCIFFFKFFYDLLTHNTLLLLKIWFKLICKKIIVVTHPILLAFFIYIIQIYKILLTYTIFLPFVLFDAYMENIQFYVSMGTYLFFISGLTYIERFIFEPNILPSLHLYYFEEYVFEVLLPKIIILSNFFMDESKTQAILAATYGKFALFPYLRGIYQSSVFNLWGIVSVIFSYTFLIFPTICVYAAMIIFFWTTFLLPLEYLNGINLRKLINRDDPRTYAQLIFIDYYNFIKNLILDFNQIFFLNFKFLKNFNFFFFNFFFFFNKFLIKKNKKTFFYFIFYIFKFFFLINDLIFDFFLIKNFIFELFNKYYKKILIYTTLAKDISSINYTGLEAIETIIFFVYYIIFIPQTSILLLEFFFYSSYSVVPTKFHKFIYIYFFTVIFYFFYVSNGSVTLTYLHIKLKILKFLSYLYFKFLLLKTFFTYLYKNLIQNFNLKLIIKDFFTFFKQMIKPIQDIHKKDNLFDVDNCIIHFIALPYYYIKDYSWAKILTIDVLSEKTNELGSFMYRTRTGPLGVLYPRLLDRIAESFTYRAFVFFRRARLYKKDKIEEKTIDSLIKNGWIIQKHPFLILLEIFFLNYRSKLNLYIDFKDDMEDAIIKVNKIYFKYLFKDFTNIKDALKKIPKSHTYVAYPYKKDAEGLNTFFYFGKRFITILEMFLVYKFLSLISCWEIILNELLYFDTTKYNKNVEFQKRKLDEEKQILKKKEKLGNLSNENLFDTLSNITISEEKTKNLSFFIKVYRCVLYKSFFYLDLDSNADLLNSADTKSIKQNFISQLVDLYIKVFSIECGEIDYQTICNNRIKTFNYYFNLEFLPTLKKKIYNLSYAFNMTHEYKKPFNIIFLKSDYNVLINLAKFLDNLPKNNINNKNFLYTDIDFFDNGIMYIYFDVPEYKIFKQKLKAEKKLKKKLNYIYTLWFFIFICIFLATFIIREPYVVLSNGFVDFDYFIYVLTW